MKIQVWAPIIWVPILSQTTLAQVVPDRTLPEGERSQVSGDPNIQINGGATRGSNLFHSFQQFSIPTNGSVLFNNATDIANIITRVTGGTRSDIDGLIRANGTANLFLMNPNGIMFGPNARLEIGGSFLASTANSLKFADGFEFSATAPQSSPLLTISVPSGLQYGSNPGEIRVQGTELQVPDGRTLTLAGGSVTIEGGKVSAPGGRVELAGVATPGEVGLRRLNVPEGLGRADVTIGNNAIVDVRSGGGGSIAINARNLTVAGNTQVRAGIAANLGTVGTQAGDIDINATEAVSLRESTIANTVRPGGTGKAGDINLTAGSLTATNGAQLSASTLGVGDAGSVKLTVSGAATFDGTTPDGELPSGAFSQVGRSARGRGSNIELTASSLTVSNGAQLGTATQGVGDAGNVKLTINGAAIFDGTAPNNVQVTSGAFSQVQGGTGKGGSLELSAGSLTVSNGAALTVSTFGLGDAGSVKLTVNGAATFDGTNPNGQVLSGAFSQVNRRASGRGGTIELSAGSLIVRNGARLSAGTGGVGDAGSVKLTVNGAAIFDGIAPKNGQVTSGAGSTVSPGATGKGGTVELTAGSITVSNGALLITSTFGVGDAGSVKLTVNGTATFDGTSPNGRFSSGAASQVERGAKGKGGNIEFTASSLTVTNGGQLSASSRGQGEAGNLDVNVRQLRLDNQGSITAQTATGRGGNIRLQVQDLLLLRRGSFISTTAGTAQAGGDGGNIILNSKFIVATPNENNDISANAFTGSGGKVNITAQGIFGIQFSPRLTALSDITASSEFGLSGTVTLNTPEVDPIRSTTPLPTGLVDANALIASSCIAQRDRQSRFIITGTDGLATQPDDLANSAFPTYELVPDTSNAANVQPPSPDLTVVEADRVVRLSNGDIVLGRSCN